MWYKLVIPVQVEIMSISVDGAACRLDLTPPVAGLHNLKKNYIIVLKHTQKTKRSQ
jgi:hypothetical protein